MKASLLFPSSLIFCLAVSIGAGCSSAGSEPDPLIFSRAVGLFEEPFSLDITATDEGIIRLTLDGSVPTRSSAAWAEPMNVTRTTELRVDLWGPEDDTAPVFASHTYLAVDSSLRGFDSSLPIVVVETFRQHRINDQEQPRPHRPVYAVFIDNKSDGGRARIGGVADAAFRGGMHVPGESSPGFEKKQYALEVWDEQNEDRDLAVLGMPAEFDWILHAPFSDKTLMRNHLAYLWSNRIGRYAPRTRFIEVFINWEDDGVGMKDYVGVYLLIEKVKRNSERVDIAKLDGEDTSGSDITGGYLLKKDHGFDEERGFRTDRYGDELTYVYPKPDKITRGQKNYIQDYIRSFEAALMSDNFADPTAGYAAFADVDSFIDHHILVEMARNVDGFLLSTYFSKNRDGLLTMGPV